MAELPAENAQLVANAAVGCAVNNANYAVSAGADGRTRAGVAGMARAREAMALRRACGAPPMAGAQVRVLQVCLAASAWAALVDELALAQAAGYAAAMTEAELRVLRRMCEQTEQAVEAGGAAGGAAEGAAGAEAEAEAAVAALRTFVTAAEAESAAAAAAAAAAGGGTTKAARGGSRGAKHLSPDAKAAARRYSRSIALPGDDEAHPPWRPSLNLSLALALALTLAPTPTPTLSLTPNPNLALARTPSPTLALSRTPSASPTPTRR